VGPTLDTAPLSIHSDSGEDEVPAGVGPHRVRPVSIPPPLPGRSRAPQPEGRATGPPRTKITLINYDHSAPASEEEDFTSPRKSARGRRVAAATAIPRERAKGKAKEVRPVSPPAAPRSKVFTLSTLEASVPRPDPAAINAVSMGIEPIGSVRLALFLGLVSLIYSRFR
jgi:hypothetical protein